MTDPDKDNNRSRALAALFLDKSDPLPGSRPSHEELWDWMHGEVTESRDVEIRHYLANDDNLYEDWRQLRLAIDEHTPHEKQQTEQNSRWSQTFNYFFSRLVTAPTGPVAGGIVAICLVVVIGVQQMQSRNQLDFWQGWQTSKGASNAALNQDTIRDLKTVLAGMQQKMKALSVTAVGPAGQAFPESAPDCQEDSACTRSSESLLILGNLLVSARHACLSESRSPESTQKQAAGLQPLLADSPSASILLPHLTRWTETATDDHQNQCAAVELLIDRALDGL